ncbi:DUF3379 domain-containing protein [Nitrogeniibacter mangrovi]|uniref:DUF3379 domain-containing protein n=1 Tax=Nitrogeniibacter mangrovi TaxID=2016596 RepID=A0A6C1B7N5_9RHOO|nr:DUF3379 family protein [Nitrogeniibacter mangrovi]QID18959.1 DUF3379 domain-containing protein [Nitrogeniibacter mangrovi]
MKPALSYTCLDLRREKLADPKRLSADARAHLAECGACRQFAHGIDTLEQQVAKVLAIPVPDGLADRVLLRVHRNQKRPWRLWALAASVLLSFGIGTVQWQPRTKPDYARFAIEHVMHEPQSFTEHRLTDPSRFRLVLANFGGHLLAPIGKVRYMRLCPVPNGTGWHIVLDTEVGPVTLLLIPGKEISGKAFEAKFAGMTARALPGGQGYYAIVAETPQIVDAVEKLIDARVRWRT